MQVSLMKGMVGAVIGLGLSMGIAQAAVLDTYSFTLGGYQFTNQGTLTGTFSAIVPNSGIFSLQDIVSFSAQFNEGQQPVGGTFTTPKSFFYNPPTPTTLSFEAFSDNGDVACMGVAALVGFDQCPKAVTPNGLTGSVVVKTQVPGGTVIKTTGSFDIPSIKLISENVVPEPRTLPMAAAGLLGMAILIRSRRTKYAKGVRAEPGLARAFCENGNIEGRWLS